MGIERITRGKRVVWADPLTAKTPSLCASCENVLTCRAKTALASLRIQEGFKVAMVECPYWKRRLDKTEAAP